MLSEYLPDDYSEDDSYLEAVLIGYIDDTAQARSVPRTNLSAYIPDLSIKPPYLSGRSITDSIEWYSLPDDHSFSPKSSGTGINPDDWQMIMTYARARGSAAHALHSSHGSEEAARALQSELASLHDVDDHDAMLDAVHRWIGSTRIASPHEVTHTSKDAADALHRSAKDGARIAADNWDMAARELDLDALIDEPTIFADIDETRYCCCPDQVVTARDVPQLPESICTLDAKTTPRFKPKHIVQAEAQRRALDAKLNAPVHGILLRLGPSRGDWDILTSQDDDWLGDEAWELFQRKAGNLYEDGRIQAALAQLDD